MNGLRRKLNAALITELNPMGTDGFEFVEFAAHDPHDLEMLFISLGFKAVARHRSRNITLWRQGNVNFLINAERSGFSHEFMEKHGSCACAIALRVADAKHAMDRSVSMGASPLSSDAGPMELNIPGIEGVGGSHIYFVDRYDELGSIYDVDFEALDGVNNEHGGFGLLDIDHLTHNVYRGNMNRWAAFYEHYFNFRQIRYFDIEGKLTGLKSRAMTSPCGKIRIPINESSDDKSQIEEFLKEYKGEGIQHIALSTSDIYRTVNSLRKAGVNFMTPPPDTYYEMLDNRLPEHGEDVESLKAKGLLVDGDGHGGILLQIFTETVIGPIFFEIIQRKGDEGFGEGNFKALFESMERDQIRRGVLEDKPDKGTNAA
ncbi:4-hydroxyphenylpyruvate dioxygenase [Sansalvadorimonas sp. 2012CJ34-2]|uniref:4-hydroxyphenylpyruvate dioxygenase n=1 Tax=Parendozoicomonas callyspongiae TaxID=2942213 RepID=A0ABT0PAV0_9GAMM|nr:4-hydroxyphenylpyruvate dioxygenase [Sansalvadorimonas sp. 2012CJ34-2]MCL6268505.1 4-hydroxyphenylpyruvate dioxygenase [Sansalvadorimonas sp. 2012CJ34-2]